MVTYRIALGPEFDTAPDDTEETLAGSSAHQDAIVAATTGLRLCARRRNLPWHVGNQLTVIVQRLSGGPHYQPAPDVLVHPTLGPALRQSLNVGIEGPPSLIIEVASPSTARERDLSSHPGRGKPALYATMGVEEYIVFDPYGEFLPTRVLAWQRTLSGVFIPWEPETNGHWLSRALGVSFAPQSFLLRIYGPDGELMPISEELDDQNQFLLSENRQLADIVDEQAQQLAARARQLAAMEAEIRRLRGE
jgi:Uma2 family endonuclease